MNGARSWLDRITDPVLREAVGLLDDGDIEGLRALLAANPDLTGRRANFEGENYFRTPTLLAFAAENPVRNDSLPPNIVAIAELLISGTAASDVQETVGLVASGRVAREGGVQDDLIVLLCRHGAEPDRAVSAALVHGEFGAVEALRRCGAGMTLPMAAGLGDLDQARAFLTAANSAERHLATAFAAQHGHAEILALLLDSGEDPDRYNPVSAHSHSTPLHQAVGHGHAAAVRTLLAHGARTDLRDTLWNGTPLDWANHAGRADMVALLGD